MKKITLLMSIIMLSSMMLFAQSGKGKVEVLYFKANLACCKAKACNALEAEIKTIVESNFKEKAVAFKVIKIADEANGELVAKHNAKSQSVILVKNKKNKEITIDASGIVQQFLVDKDKAGMETALVEKINELKKMK